jgi:hypothetical protein
MQRISPRALLACINEGRQPSAIELESVTDMVWREAFVTSGRSDNRECAAMLAKTALTGHSLV